MRGVDILLAAQRPPDAVIADIAPVDAHATNKPGFVKPGEAIAHIVAERAKDRVSPDGVASSDASDAKETTAAIVRITPRSTSPPQATATGTQTASSASGFATLRDPPSLALKKKQPVVTATTEQHSDMAMTSRQGSAVAGGAGGPQKSTAQHSNAQADSLESESLQIGGKTLTESQFEAAERKRFESRKLNEGSSNTGRKHEVKQKQSADGATTGTSKVCVCVCVCVCANDYDVTLVPLWLQLCIVCCHKQASVDPPPLPSSHSRTRAHESLGPRYLSL